MPNYEAPQTHSVTADEIKVNLSNKPDPRLNKNLTIQEFIQAFGKCKRIMWSVYPERREEFFRREIIQLPQAILSKSCIDLKGETDQSGLENK